ncbi:hypothetical protein HMPREF2761_08410 [Streptococcus sp. HMSC057E02]|nr:hypothetical protein HMPREF2761_08410 [Streptococcus sp. HMSC057E02]
MKKIVSILLFGLATIFLIPCSKQKSLDGDYYWISDNRNEKIMTVELLRVMGIHYHFKYR